VVISIFTEEWIEGRKILQAPAHGSGQSQAQIQAGHRMDWEQPWGEGLGGIGHWDDPAIFAHSPEGELYPGLHQKKCGQQGKEGILPLCSALVTAHLESYIQLWSPQHRKDTDLFEQVQRTPQQSSEGWNISPMRKGCKSRDCSTLRRKSSEETL